MPAPPPSRTPPPPGRRPARGGRAVAIGGLAAALALSGCGVRLETPPPPIPSADAAEAARQDAATRSEDLATLAGAALATGTGAADSLADTLARVATDAKAHAGALGGVWTPPAWATTPPGADEVPAATPSQDSTPGGGSVTAGAGTSASPSGSPAVVLGALATASLAACGDAVVLEPADLARLLASICLAQDAAARALAAASGLDAPAPGARTVVERAAADPTPTEGPPAFPSTLARGEDGLPLARSLDAAGYALEVAAARASGADRDALAGRAREHRAEARALVAAAGALGTPEDPRRAAYDLPEVDGATPGPAALAADAETGVLAAWTATFGDAPVSARALVLAEMVTAAAAATGWGAPPSTFPGLPGG